MNVELSEKELQVIVTGMFDAIKMMDVHIDTLNQYEAENVVSLAKLELANYHNLANRLIDEYKEVIF